MARAVQHALHRAYRFLIARGLMRHPWGRRAFFRTYDVYKALLEAGPVDRLRAQIPAGAFVIDVGANVGFFTLRFLEWVGPAGRVLAIEPEPENFAEMTRRIRRCGYSDRADARCAVADAASGEARLLINPEHPGDHRLGEYGMPVAAVALDDVVGPGMRVALIKIDVQGAEMRVLAGARGILVRDHPALFVEIDPPGLARFGSSVDDVLQTLGGAGYRPYLLGRRGPRHCDRAEIDAALRRSGYIDLLFLAAAP